MREILRYERQRLLGIDFFNQRKKMCYQVEVLEYNEDKAIITVGELCLNFGLPRH